MLTPEITSFPNNTLIHCSSKIIFLILNCLTFCLRACNISENTVYNIRSNNSFLGKIAKRDFSYELYYTELDFRIVFIFNSLFFYQTRIKIQSELLGKSLLWIFGIIYGQTLNIDIIVK